MQIFACSWFCNDNELDQEIQQRSLFSAENSDKDVNLQILLGSHCCKNIVAQTDKIKSIYISLIVQSHGYKKQLLLPEDKIDEKADSDVLYHLVLPIVVHALD